jgi:glutathione S-transferase
MIELYQFFPAFGQPTASSFCLKLAAYLRMADLPYKAVDVDRPGKSPKGKLPFIRDGGVEVADSGIIIDYLKAKYGDSGDLGDLADSELSPEQQAVSLATQRLVEESLYWSAMYARWVEPEGWAVLAPAFFGVIPKPARGLVASLIRRKIIRDIRGHGRGLLTQEEVYASADKDLTALSALLGEKPYFMGDKPTTLDAVVYGLLALIYFVPIDSPLKTKAESLNNLKAHAERIREAYFPVERP